MKEIFEINGILLLKLYYIKIYLFILFEISFLIL